ncbi:hypothetical protein Tco_0127219 [Tanacetum coccineum]
MVDFVPGRAVIDAAQCKHGKYMAKRAAIGYGFILFLSLLWAELEAYAQTGMADFVHGRAMIDAAQRKHGQDAVYMAARGS